ncbi:MAG TPA: NUDIX hydrolase [Candidatus Aquilonibacter sp.]|nr:NUDIX hydrolase [Candidatus Aquilonibacter sp.]
MAAKKTSSSARKTTTTGKESSPKPIVSAQKKLTGRARLLSSKTVYKGKVFWVTSDEVLEPGGVRAHRDVVRHNGSVVILAVDSSRNPNDPDVLLIRQYRHAAGQFLLELPAGRIEPGERLRPAAKRELLEETGYRARRWSHLVRYYASPGFVAESMDILLAEDLVHAPGEGTPDEDERIELYPTSLSEAVRLALTGRLHDGKSLIGILFYATRKLATI